MTECTQEIKKLAISSLKTLKTAAKFLYMSMFLDDAILTFCIDFYESYLSTVWAQVWNWRVPD